jgi:hypothetical protein
MRTLRTLRTWIGAAALVSLALASPAQAHMPSLVDGAFADWREPFVVSDLDWSQVVYHRAGCETPTLWMRMQAQAGASLFVQLGAPELERQIGRRLQIAVLGPGLTDVVPAGLEGSGAATAEVFEATLTTETPAFFEPFSDTHSRILVEETLKLPATGTYYVAARFVDGQAGKLWVSTGTVEKFDAEAIKRVVPLLDEVKRFHETIEDDWAPTDGVDPTCPVAPPTDGDLDETTGGCSAARTGTSGARGWLMLAFAAIMAVARRRASQGA